MKKRYVFALLYLHTSCFLIVLRIMLLIILYPFKSLIVHFILGYTPILSVQIYFCSLWMFRCIVISVFTWFQATLLKNYKRVDWLLVEIVVKTLILAWSESEFVFVPIDSPLPPLQQQTQVRNHEKRNVPYAHHIFLAYIVL